MENKLGITNPLELKRIEYNISNFKHKLLNENFLFNEESIFSIAYLEKIHTFLFQDIFSETFCRVKDNISEETLAYAQNTLYKIKKDVLNNDLCSLANDVYTLWEYQMFVDGNTRTIRAFLKIVCLGYGLNVRHNFDEDINEDYFIGRLVDEISEVKKEETKKLVEVIKWKKYLNTILEEEKL